MNNTPIPFIVKQDSINVYLNGKMETVDSSHPSFSKVKQALIDKKFDLIETLVNVSTAIRNFTRGSVKIENGLVYYQGKPLHNALTSRILAMHNEGFPFEHMLKFLDNLYLNPSNNSVEQLYYFLEHKNLPITDDGHFLAYKAVRNDYLDKYSGTISNAIGQKPEMPRNKVCDDFKQHCQAGLHCGAIDYVKSYGNVAAGDRVVIVKVNPADAVSVPNDVSYQKLRVSKYEVVDELKDLSKIFNTSVVVSSTPVVDTESEYDKGYEHGKNDALNENGHYTFNSWTSDYRDGYDDGYTDYEQIDLNEDEESSYSSEFTDYVYQWLNANYDKYQRENNGVEPTLGVLRDETPYTSKFSSELSKLISEYGEDESVDFVYSKIVI